MKFTKKDMKKFAVYFAGTWLDETALPYIKVDAEDEFKKWIKKHKK